MRTRMSPRTVSKDRASPGIIENNEIRYSKCCCAALGEFVAGLLLFDGGGLDVISQPQQHLGRI